MNKKTH